MKYSRKINPLTKNSIKCRKKDCSKNHVEKNPESADFVVTEQITFWLKKKPLQQKMSAIAVWLSQKTELKLFV